MKVYEAIQMLETMPAGAEVNTLALESAVERNKAIKKKEVEDFLAIHAVKARGYESFLKPSGYVCSVYVNVQKSWEVKFDEAYSYAYVDCGNFFDVYRTGLKETVEVTLDGK